MRTYFGDFTQEYTRPENAKNVILPVPYDATSTWTKGADKAPQAIIDASYQLEMYDIETDYEVYKYGIHTAPMLPVEGLLPEEMILLVEQEIEKYLHQNKFIVTIGGEHSISAGIVKAFSKFYNNFAVLQLDAHADLRQEYHGSKYNHACVMARIAEVCPFVQVGIRSVEVNEKNSMDLNRTFFAHQIQNRTDWFDKVITLLPQNVYITIDVDAFDPSTLPHTGTPEPGGLTWYQITGLIKKIACKKNIIGADVVELCPNPQSLASNFLTAKLIYKLLSYKWASA